MDPVATLAIIRDNGVLLADRLDALHALASWTQLGGFMPGVLDVRRVINCTITVAYLLGEFDIATDTDVRELVQTLLTTL
ncbi:MAG: hypothetical protein KA274_18620 [Ilumatobacteraceae bacterium]|jgi:hypothetical protein|nr:hypothetical protein [Ilumatobacteraceae bacterium]